MLPNQCSIALVEDRIDSIELLTYALNKSLPQMQVVPCSAADLLMHHISPLAVITRYKLPGEINGVELTRRLRHERFSGPIILISNSEEIGPSAKLAGADEFLSFEHWAEVPARLSAMLAAQT